MPQKLTEFLNSQSWLFPVIVIIAVLVANRLMHWLLSARLRHVRPYKAVWRHAVMSALDAPARALIWLMGVALVKQKFFPQGVQILVDRFYAPTMGVLTRSEEHTSELQSLMRISYAVFCLKKKK